MSDDLRTRIAKVLHSRQATDDAPEGWVWTWEQESDYEKESWLADADAVIAELNSDGVEPARLQERLDNIGRWLHPGLWSGMDGRRGIFLRILAGEQIEPPESARSTDWKADDE